MITFGGIMKLQMEKLNIKQEVLARELNIARTTVTSYCNDIIILEIFTNHIDWRSLRQFINCRMFSAFALFLLTAIKKNHRYVYLISALFNKALP